MAHQTPIEKKVFNPAFSRRAFLGGLGLGAAASPFVPLLNASAQESLFPKRLLLFFTPHGTVYDNWKPTGTEANFTLGRILAPLERHKKKIVVLAGMEIKAPGVGAPHTKGPPLLWTASKLLEDQTFIRSDGSGGRYFGWNSGPSFDQVMAEKLGTKTPYKSIELGVRSGGSHPGSRTIYTAAKQPVPPEANPYSALGRLFSGAGGKGLDQLRAERKSAIDVLRAELDALKAKAAMEDRAKLDSHLTSLRGIETRLAAAPSQCPAPTVGANRVMDVNAAANMPIVWDLQMDIVAAALACDLTRIASLQFRVGENDNDRYSWLGIDHEGHHLLTHSGDTNAVEKENLSKIYTWYTERFAYLLDKLDAVKEGNGTMLDNTLVVWGSELGKGNSHAFKRTPFVVAGSGGGVLRTGRFLDYEAGGANAAHNRLLVSLFHAMGLPDVTTFGNTDTGTGPLPRFLG
jgi:hypothetical protein